jgi:hypothetical protein
MGKCEYAYRRNGMSGELGWGIEYMDKSWQNTIHMMRTTWPGRYDRWLFKTRRESPVLSIDGQRRWGGYQDAAHLP